MESTTTLPTIALTALAGNDVPHLNALQELLVPYTTELITFWWFAWLIVAMLVIRFVFVHGKRNARSNSDLYSD